MAAKIVVACGSGIATSRMVAKKLDKMLAEEDVEADVVAVNAADLPRELADAVAYVAVVEDENSYDVPVIDGSTFLTGVDEAEDEFARLLAAVRG